ncbi:sugar transferase [Legionella clemsonensis]|uniref:Putative sugar transferase EpsL n=1 Tax=Legionella clemsonensis TaxID=1867846 RepID=A0A222P3J4_9GAMM|nr:sugar transferase [Legionella clemsonensis]ASQ46403.1 putative sugar transferase EpsL [Legionella clemsonensis]
MVKRIFDILFSGAVLLIMSPLILIIGFLIRYNLGTPIFFYQSRPGQHSKIFKIIKFRTMKDATNVQGELLPDEQRLTRLGRFLRSTSLDELPQLWNVLMGQMSLVGPRPLLVEYLPLYNSEQRRRHEVKPGITGLAQVSGRNALKWEDKFKLDVWYVDNQTFWLDIKILFLTLKKVLIRDGITSEGNATAKKFEGSEQ